MLGIGKATLESASSDVLTITKSLTSAQLLDLAANPVILVPAPGIGKFVSPVYASFIYRFKTTPYSVVGGVNLLGFYGTDPTAATNIQISETGFMDAGTSQVSAFAGGISGTLGLIQVDNLPFVLGINIPLDMTTGDGTLDVVLAYTINE